MKTLRFGGRAVRVSGSVLGLAMAAVLSAMSPVRAGESLADVMVEAYLNSPEMASQRANIRIAAENAVQAAAQGRVSVTGQIGVEIGIDEGPFDSGNGNTWTFPTTLSLTAVQPLYTGGQVENATTAAERRLTSQEVVLTATEQQLLLDAAIAFLDVRRDGFLLDVAQNNVRVLSEQLRAARERFEVGEVTRTDVEQARAALAAARSNLAAAEGQLRNSRETFAEFVGRPPGELLPPPPLPDLPESLDAAVQLALRNEPNLRAARIEREASGFDVKAAIGALLPQISLQGQLSQTDEVRDGLGSSRSANVGVFVTIPFYSGGANYSAVREAQAAVAGAEASIIATLRDAIRNTGVAWSTLEVARASIEAGRLEVHAAQLAFEGVTEEAKVGARTTLDVLDAEADVLDAKVGLISAQRDEYVAAYRLLASLGLLTVAHLGLDIGAPPDAGSYYASVRDRNFGYDPSDDTVWSLSYRP
ncbi:TolC family outer membrane protein [Paralimibaculum aggregatum]|uniref:TolC family outer membrane protein n=1 Tax=Paralimibaculum aggregatum TaxID=3036245 RepID=A0ABQ6LR17_9RHOB|nr:TolC family outer membrane protein [Limibaculum sp. NKW23]GMG83609.1 TolC family outer membrane protein [Limibaculum sp. NKW23]